jgi:hypothetical protein
MAVECKILKIIKMLKIFCRLTIKQNLFDVTISRAIIMYLLLHTQSLR